MQVEMSLGELKTVLELLHAEQKAAQQDYHRRIGPPEHVIFYAKLHMKLSQQYQKWHEREIHDLYK